MTLYGATIPMLGIISNNANPIYTLNIPGRKGVIGMCACPGIRLETTRRGNLQKNLKRDLLACQQWGASGILSLNVLDELHGLGLGDLGMQIMDAGFWWRNMPIADMDVPDSSFEDMWSVEGKQLVASLISGEKIVIHCLAGLGRTGMIAARLLVEMGMAPALAVAEIRKIRPRAIQTDAQESYVHQFGRNKQQGDQVRQVQQPARTGQYATIPRGPIKGFGT